jgi:methyl-accepting chemotaxis protein
MQYTPNYPNMDKLFLQPKIPKIEVPTYEKGKSPIELLESQSAYLKKTSEELHNMAQSAKSQADSAKEIAESSKTQADVALKTSSKADVKGWISVAVSIICALMEFSVHHSEIIDFIKALAK